MSGVSARPGRRRRRRALSNVDWPSATVAEQRNGVVSARGCRCYGGRAETCGEQDYEQRVAVLCRTPVAMKLYWTSVTVLYWLVFNELIRGKYFSSFLSLSLPHAHIPFPSLFSIFFRFLFTPILPFFAPFRGPLPFLIDHRKVSYYKLLLLAPCNVTH